MKILTVFSLGVFVLGITGTALGATLGVVVDPLEEGEFSVSAEYNHVFDRDIDDANTDVDEYEQIYANISYGVTPNLKLYTKLGAADMNINGTASGDATEEEYDSGFLWGLGVSGYLRVLNDEWIIGFAGEYTAWETDLDAITVAGATGTNLAGGLDNDERQLSIYAAKEIFLGDMRCLPYVGIKFARLESDYDDLSFDAGGSSYVGSGTAKNEDEVGILAGVNLKMAENFRFNLEGQFLDETGVTVSGTYKF